MSEQRRYVFDTNTLVSALLFEQSTPGRALYAAIDTGRLLLCQETSAELAEVLARPKLERYFEAEDRERFLTAVAREAVEMEITGAAQGCRDPKDDKFLELASLGGAQCIVSGDRDLLVLQSFQGIPVLTPAQFLEWISKGE